MALRTFEAAGFTEEQAEPWLQAGLQQYEVAIALMLIDWGEGPEYLDAHLDTGQSMRDYLRSALVRVQFQHVLASD